MPETLRIWLLGGFRVSVGSRRIGEDEWHLRKARSLLKVLALAAGHRLHREQAMELLWPDLDPRAALNNLHYALHVARRTLEPSALDSSSATSRYLRLQDDQLKLCPDSPVWVDVEAFEEAAATARRTLEPQAFQAAMDLYTGELCRRIATRGGSRSGARILRNSISRCPWSWVHSWRSVRSMSRPSRR